MRRSVLVLLLCPFFGCAHSDSDDQSRRNRWTPFQFGIAKDIQLVNPTYDVLGARLNFVHGRNRDVKGLDVGFLNDTLGDAAGIQVAAFGHRVEGNSWGVQVGGFANRVGTEKRPRTHRGLQVGGVNFGGIRGIQVGGLSNGFFAGEHFHIELAGESKGLQISAGVNSSQKMTGAQIAGANWSKGDAVGLQLAGLVNFTDKELRGAQVSFVLNKANEGQGVQFGAINIVDHEFEGLQISAGVNSSQKMTGAQIAGANWSKGDAVGLQLAGLVNFTDKELRGAQVSFVLNKANEGQGVQLGAINIVDHEFGGIQLGVVNVARSGFQIGLWNDNKNGFLPYFPLFNFSLGGGNVTDPTSRSRTRETPTARTVKRRQTTQTRRAPESVPRQKNDVDPFDELDELDELLKDREQ